MTEELKKVVDIIVRDFAPDKIILFGSGVTVIAFNLF